MVCEDVPADASVRQPADEEPQSHDDHQTVGVSLTFIDCIAVNDADQSAEAHRDDGQRDDEVHGEHVVDEGFVEDIRLQGVIIDAARALQTLGDVTRPLKERRQRTGESHKPGEADTLDDKPAPGANVNAGSTGHHAPLDGQDYQRPQRDLGTMNCEEAFEIASHHPVDKVAVHGRVHGERKADHDYKKVSHRHVHQDVVDWRAQVLVHDRHAEREQVDRDAGKDQEEHVDGDEREHPRLSQVVLRILMRAPHYSSRVGHGDVEIGALCAIHD